MASQEKLKEITKGIILTFAENDISLLEIIEVIMNVFFMFSNIHLNNGVPISFKTLDEQWEFIQERTKGKETIAGAMAKQAMFLNLWIVNIKNNGE